MSWENGIFTRTNGTYEGDSVWQDDEANGFDILSQRADFHDQDIAEGVNACLNRDGSNTMSGALPMGSSKITGLAEGEAGTDAVNKDQLDAVNALIGALVEAGDSNGQAVLWDAAENKYSPTNNIGVDSTGLSTWIGGNNIEGIQVYGIGQGTTFIAASEKDDAIGDATKKLNVQATDVTLTASTGEVAVKTDGKQVGLFDAAGRITLGDVFSNLAHAVMIKNDGNSGILRCTATDNTLRMDVKDDGSVGINIFAEPGFPLRVYDSDTTSKRLEITDEGEVTINGNHVNGTVFLVYDATGSNKLFQVGNGGDVYMPEVYDNTTTLKPNVHMDPNGRLFRSTSTWT